MENRFPRNRKIIQMAKCLMEAGNLYGAAQLAEARYPWDRELNSLLQKTATASSLADLMGNSEYRAAVESFVETLQSRSIHDRLAAAGMVKVKEMTRILLAISVPNATGSAALNKSNLTKTISRPVSKLSLNSEELVTQAITATIIATEEAIRDAGANDYISAMLGNGVAAACDAAFWAWAVEQVGSSVLTADAGLEPQHEIKNLLDVVCLTGNERPHLVVYPTLANYLATASDAATGALSFPEMTPQGGFACGVPVLVSDQITGPTSAGEETVLMADAAGLCYADSGLELKSSNAGMVDLSDSPTAGSPANLVSLFQEDLRALGGVRWLAWKTFRTNALAIMEGITWATPQSS